MAKPQWIKIKEQINCRIGNLCETCSHYGKIVKYAQHKGRETVSVHECAIYPKCYNTKYSIQCEDYLPKET